MFNLRQAEKSLTEANATSHFKTKPSVKSAGNFKSPSQKRPSQQLPAHTGTYSAVACIVCHQSHGNHPALKGSIEPLSEHIALRLYTVLGGPAQQNPQETSHRKDAASKRRRKVVASVAPKEGLFGGSNTRHLTATGNSGQNKGGVNWGHMLGFT
ncbi:hypothetical protein RRG08_018988 [Elysia crispata]|uniref:Uncharacterized protein n=1 Tax=Elysia crispata TaxID=231223 RepID=A0AAE1A708_9GAST|nr:hypothetical protein RRG08_018988 [Elysia crispata]